MGKKAKKGRTKRNEAGKPTISVCMIVKNEEELLPRCLQSIENLVDEIILVDTGSSDRTVEIAESYGAKVYHHPWENDFSKHRNQSISYASAEWILVIDADEVISCWEKHAFQILQDKNTDSVYVKVENVFAQGECTAWHNSIRLFRRNGAISYEGKVHNELRGYGSSRHSHIVIDHSGYALNPMKEEEKFRRTTGLLEEEIQSNPEDPRNHHYLSVSLLGQRFYDLALEEAEKALSLASKEQGKTLYLWTRFVAAVSCINLGKVEEAERFCMEGLKLNPLNLDAYYILSSISYSRGSLQLFLENSDHYLSLLAKAKKSPGHFEDMVHNTIEHEWRIRLHRGFALEKLGLPKKARREYQLSLKFCPDRSEYLRLYTEWRHSTPEIASPGEIGLKGWTAFSQPSGRYQGNIQRKESIENEKMPKTGAPHRDCRKSKKERGISLCMIVKNEEELLPKCLASAKDHVDEIVVVDTGSLDRTVEIAESYGARVFLHAWEGDFSKHRNQSIDYSTKEWILILDADEMLDPKSAGLLRNVLREKNADSIYLSVRSAFDGGQGEAIHNSVRLIRNNGKIRYEGRVHNQLIGHQSSIMYPVTVFHEGYNLTAEKSYQKFLRTTELLKKEIEELPDQPRGYHYLAASYLSEGMHREAQDHAVKAIELAEKHGYSDHLYLWSHFIAGISGLKLDKLEEAEEVCLRALSNNSMHLDSHYLLALIYSNLKQWEKVIYHGYEYCRLVEEFATKPGAFGQIVHNTVNHRWRVHLHLGFALEEMEDPKKAEKEFAMAERFCSERVEYHKLLAEHYFSTSRPKLAETFFEKALESRSSDVEFLRIGVEIYAKLGEKEKEKALLKDIIDRDASQEESLFRIGTILLQENSLEEASRFLQNVITVNPRHTGALINLGLVAKRENNLEEAVSFFKMAILEDPFSVEGLSNLGYTLYHKGDLIGAEDAFERVSRIGPELVDPLLLLSRIHVEQERFERAVEDCDSLLKLLHLDRNVILQSRADLAELYLKIGGRLIEKREMSGAYWAFGTALLLSKNAPNMLQRILALYTESGSSDKAFDLKNERVDFIHSTTRAKNSWT